MIFKVIVAVIFVVVMEKTIVVGTRQTSDEDEQEDNNLEKVYAGTSTEEEKPCTYSHEAKNSTSHERSSYYSKRGAPKYTMRIPYHRGSRRFSKHRKIISHTKSRNNHRRNRSRLEFPRPPVIHLSPLTVSKPPSHTKITFKRSKPILLSEVLQSGPSHPYAKFKPPSRLMKEYLHPVEKEVEQSDFYSFYMDSLPRIGSKYEKTPSNIQISENIHNGLVPLSDTEDEIYHPGAVDTQPFPPLKGVPSPQIYSSIKSPNLYVDDELQDNIRNIRFTSKPPNGYVQHSVMSMLRKMRDEGIEWDSELANTIDSYLKENFTDMKVAISKILLPFVSEHPVKKLHNHISTAPNGVQTQSLSEGGGGGGEKNITKVTYVVEDLDRELFGKNTSNEVPPPTPLVNYSVREPTENGGKNNATTYYIMLKTLKGFKNKNSTATVFQTGKNHTKVEEKRHEHTTRQSEIPTTITNIANITTKIPSQQNLALQHYIMSLAGLTQNQDQNYSPQHTNSLDKQLRSYY